jgi:hypothetical protein
VIVKALSTIGLVVFALEYHQLLPVLRSLEADPAQWADMARQSSALDGLICCCFGPGYGYDEVARALPYAGPLDCGCADRHTCITDRLRAHVEAYEAGTTVAEVERASPTGVAFVKPTRLRSAGR